MASGMILPKEWPWVRKMRTNLTSGIELTLYVVCCYCGCILGPIIQPPNMHNYGLANPESYSQVIMFQSGCFLEGTKDIH
jgi:hypothetical protein